VGIAPGEPWGDEVGPDPDGVLVVTGEDRDLARAVGRATRGALIRFVAAPTSDVARSVGLGERPTRDVALPLDCLAFDDGSLAVNAVILGTPPDRLRAVTRRFPVRVTVDDREAFSGRATTVVVATGEFLRGHDLSPRGHPGDGRAEIQIYALPADERRAMRRRLGTGSHLPHGRIIQRTGRRIRIEADRERPVEADGHAAAPRAGLSVEVVPEAFRLLV